MLGQGIPVAVAGDGFFTMPGVLQVARGAMSDAAAFLRHHCS